MTTPPLPYTPDVETLAPDEHNTVEALTKTFDTILKRTAQDYAHAVRAVHAKSHGVLEGEMTIHAGLPPELAQGMFATPGRHKVFLRLSTNAGDILPDSISLPRGLAMKVLDVDGGRLAGAEGRTQDFIMVNGPVFQSKTADKFLSGLKLLARTTDRIVGTKKLASALLRGVRHAFEAVGASPPPVVSSLGGAPNVEPLGATYYSTVPFRYGDYIAKFSMAPVSPAMTALTGKLVAIGGRENAIREAVQRQMGSVDAAWEFRVQLCRDIARQPVEDPTALWDETAAPFAPVATVRVPAQDSWDDAQVQAVNEGMRFSVWTGLEAHRPLGNINRARREVYRHSADFRARVNACPYHEP